MSHCFRKDLEEFLDKGFVVARDPNTKEIRAILSGRDKFKIPEIHKLLFGEEIGYSIKINIDSSED